MIPAEFDYTAPETLDDAIKALADGGEDAKLLAGGHSLLPLMKLRLAAPSLLVDLRRVPGLHGIQRENGNWRIGALTPHADLEHTPDLGVVSRGGRDDRRSAGAQPRDDRRVAGPRRSRLGPAGSDADLRGLGDPAGRRRAAALGRPLPTCSRTTWRPRSSRPRCSPRSGFRRSTAGATATRSSTAAARTGQWWRVSALVKKSGDTIEDVRVGLTNMASVPLRARAVEEALRGQPASAESIARRRPSRQPRAPTRRPI